MLISPGQPNGAVRSGRDLADKIKQRSTLVGLVEPAGMVLGAATQPLETLATFGDIASSVIHGDFGEAGSHLTGFVDDVLRPEGIGGIVYKSGLGLTAAVNTAVGGLELYEGLKNQDKYLALMGGADLLGAVSNVALMAGAPVPAMGINIVSQAGKVFLVLKNQSEFSRIQKAKTLFDAAGTVSSSLLRTGLATGPALVGNAVFGVGQILYMNHEGFRTRVDHLLDKILHKDGNTQLTKKQHPLAEKDPSASFQALD
ncbi:MAG: hypothetical protein AB7S38_43625 [Vulcanimicrobiota bacterium]